MKTIVDFCVVPMGVGLSVSEYIARCQKVIEEAGMTPHMHAYGTTIEGEWDEVLAVVKQCHEAVHAMGVKRISTSIRLGTRTDREQSITSKVKSVKDKLQAKS